MIATIQGKVSDLPDDHVVLELGGIGIQVFVPAHTRVNMHIGDSIFLFTYLVVREESLTLFGFENRESRDYFLLLLGVNGIGPRSALAILSTLEPETIRRAVIQEQPDIFTRAPGIGKRTAQKILLYLQDRLPVSASLETFAAISDVDGEVLAALTALGYSVVEAQAAIQNIPRETVQDVEIRLRLALQYFSKP